MPLSVDELAERVRPWAEANMPDAWRKTQEQASRPASYAKFLARLIRRWYESGARDIPLSVLQESDLRVKLRFRDGGEFDVCGRYADGDQRFNFAMLAASESPAQIRNFFAGIDAFDAVIDYLPPKPLPPYRIPPKEKVVPVVPKKEPNVILELIPRYE